MKHLTTRPLKNGQDDTLKKKKMFSEEMPDRNPETMTQKEVQEVPADVDKQSTGKDQKQDENKAASAKPQLTKAEQKEIIGLLQGKRLVKEDQTKQKKKRPAKQIVSEEAAVIRNLLHDRIPESFADEPPGAETSPKKQIDQAERKEIISLLREELPDLHEHTDDQEEYDLDHMNKQELVELLEEVVEERDITLIKKKVARIKSAFYHHNKEDRDRELQDFIARGGQAEEYQHVEDPLELRFNAAFSKYRHHKSKYAEELEKEKQHNLELKQQILEDLKQLIDSEETLKKTYDEFRNLQTRWKEIGMVPAGELNDLWQNYHFLVERFFDKVRINKELRDLDLKKNLELKIELCEKAEELLMENSIIKSFKLLQQYHDEWREIGPVPGDVKDEIWARFKTATDKINDRRKEHYKELQQEQEKNYEAKEALCEKLEEITAATNETLRDWQKRTNQVNELFKVWKTIGRAPKAGNEEIWRRFKETMDAFFAGKREFLGKLKEQQLHNLNLKIDLCAKAEAIKDNTDWRNTTRDLIGLQKEWKRIGPVPRRQSDKIWKRFRAACDEFFNRKAEFFKNIHVVEEENMKVKENLVKEIEQFKVEKDKDQNLEALKQFQRKWMEIGHVPIKEKDKIQQRYRKAVDGLINKMDINKLEFTKTEYENKVESMKKDPDSSWKLNKERNSLAIRIKKLKDDLAVWENNIGFFASSKQSEKLKHEFEKKIDLAKKEVAGLEAKLRILNKG